MAVSSASMSLAAVSAATAPAASRVMPAVSLRCLGDLARAGASDQVAREGQGRSRKQVVSWPRRR